MADMIVDGVVEEAVIRRRRKAGSVYERIIFRLADGSAKTWAKAIALNEVGDLLVPGTRGRFYLYTAIDHRGVAGVRAADGREAFGISRLNEKAGLWVTGMGVVTNVLYVTVLEKFSVLALILAVLGIPMFLLYRQVRLDAEKAYRADAGFRPAAAAPA